MNTEATTATPVAEVKSVTTKAKPAGHAARKAAKKPSKPIVTKPAAKAKAKPAAKAKAKPAAKKLKANDSRLIPADLSTYVKDSEHKTAGGHISVHCGDAVASKLLGKDLDQVYVIAAKALKEDEKALRKQYAHLNRGMQRMNLGNRMRGATA